MNVCFLLYFPPLTFVQYLKDLCSGLANISATVSSYQASSPVWNFLKAMFQFVSQKKKISILFFVLRTFWARHEHTRETHTVVVSLLTPADTSIPSLCFNYLNCIVANKPIAQRGPFFFSKENLKISKRPAVCESQHILGLLLCRYDQVSFRKIGMGSNDSFLPFSWYHTSELFFYPSISSTCHFFFYFWNSK